MESEAAEIQAFLESVSLRVVSPKQPGGNLYETREDILEQLKTRPYALGYFTGQTVLHFQKEFFEKFGTEKLAQLVKQVYGKRLYEFGFTGTVAEHTQSYDFELPSDVTEVYLELNSIDDETLRAERKAYYGGLLRADEPMLMVKELLDLIEQI